MKEGKEEMAGDEKMRRKRREGEETEKEEEERMVWSSWPPYCWSDGSTLTTRGHRRPPCVCVRSEVKQEVLHSWQYWSSVLVHLQ